MKRTACLILCLTMIFVMSGCSKDNFMDVYAFTYYYNRCTTGEQLNMEDYLIKNGSYSQILGDGGTRLLLTLKESEGGKIEEIRLLIPKVDAKGEAVLTDESDVRSFCDRLRDIMGAYTDFSSEELEKVIKEMSLDKPSTFSAEGELTMTKRDWHTVYYSNALASVFMIFNIHLHPVEKTEKPVSKPDFGNTAYTREK